MATAPRVTGVREAMAALKEVDKKLERDLRKRMGSAAKPLQAAAQAKIPSAAPMSNWTRGRYAYDGGAARGGVKVKVGGAARKNRWTWPLVTLTQSNAAGIIYDMAGRRSRGRSKSGVQFIANLNRFGRASRSMWPAAEQNRKVVDAEILKAIEDTTKTVNAKIGKW